MVTPTRHRYHSSAETAGGVVARVLAPLLAARGFPAATILKDWPDIVGSELASYATPERLVWPRGEDAPHQNTHRSRRLEGATLTIRVAGPRAIEAQHEADRIIERMNIYFGWRAISQLRIIQGPARRRRPESGPTPRRTTREPAEPGPGLSGIESVDLKRALTRLGQAVKSV